MGSQGSWLATRDKSSQILHRIITVRCSLGWGHSISFVGGFDCQWSLLRCNDRDFCLVGECRRLWIIRKMAPAGLDRYLLDIPIWNDDDHKSKSMARGNGYVCHLIYRIWCYFGILCSRISQTCTVHATRPPGS